MTDLYGVQGLVRLSACHGAQIAAKPTRKPGDCEGASFDTIANALISLRFPLRVSTRWVTVRGLFYGCGACPWEG